MLATYAVFWNKFIMAHLLNLKTNSDHRGSLIAIESEVGFNIKRIYYIYDVPHDSIRAGHGHIKNKQALIAIKGSLDIELHDKAVFTLKRPDQCLMLEPCDWHRLLNFSEDCILLVLASELYDKNDYIDNPKEITK